MVFENLVNYERDKTGVVFVPLDDEFENLVNYERDKTRGYEKSGRKVV